MNAVVVLLSGGQDSTTCLHWALQEYPDSEVHALSFDYGQRHRAELEVAKGIAARVAASHTVLTLSVLKELGSGALVSGSELTADGGLSDHAMPQGLPSSFVPGRNLLFFSAAAAFAVKVGATKVVTGVCQTDYAGYPDCRNEFVQAMNKAIMYGMPASCPVDLVAPLMWLTKAETVALAMRLGPLAWADVGRSITCYEGLHKGCGICGACMVRAAGFADAGLADPALS